MFIFIYFVLFCIFYSYFFSLFQVVIFIVYHPNILSQIHILSQINPRYQYQNTDKPWQINPRYQYQNTDKPWYQYIIPDQDIIPDEPPVSISKYR